MANEINEKISEHNARVYMDIATDMLDKKQGTFTFIVTVDGKNISSYTMLDDFSYARGSNH